MSCSNVADWNNIVPPTKQSPIDRWIEERKITGEPRIDWWKRIQGHIKEKRFFLVQDLLRAHSQDIDFLEQHILIAHETAFQFPI